MIISLGLGGAAGDLVAKAVHDAGVGHRGAVGVVDALGHGDQQPPALGPLLLDGGQELLLVKVGLGQVHQVLTGHLAGEQGGCGGDPPGVAAHELHHHHVDGQGGGIEGQLQGGHGGVLGCAPKARAVVGDRQVIVDGLRQTDDVQTFLRQQGSGFMGAVAP